MSMKNFNDIIGDRTRDWKESNRLNSEAEFKLLSNCLRLIWWNFVAGFETPLRDNFVAYRGNLPCIPPPTSRMFLSPPLQFSLAVQWAVANKSVCFPIALFTAPSVQHAAGASIKRSVTTSPVASLMSILPSGYACKPAPPTCSIRLSPIYTQIM